MEVIKSKYNEIKIEENLTIALGNFDGLHVGHEKLIEEVLKYDDTKKAILSFIPHTLTYFKGDSFKVLTNMEEKLNKAGKYNLDYFIFVNFDDEFKNLNEKAFVQFLNNLNVKRIILGSDAKFAKNGSVNANILSKYFEVIIIPDLIINNIRISSTYIKELLTNGDLALANKYLSGNYKITGIVTHGNKLGAKLGFPTANIIYDNYLLPKDGVYFVKVDNHYGICNIGNNPSINYSENKRLEVHIFDFKDNIYNKPIIVEFIKYLRPEIKFKTKEELINQLKIDEEKARSMI